jgi:hypothetical protein
MASREALNDRGERDSGKEVVCMVLSVDVQMA